MLLKRISNKKEILLIFVLIWNYEVAEVHNRQPFDGINLR